MAINRVQFQSALITAFHGALRNQGKIARPQYSYCGGIMIFAALAAIRDDPWQAIPNK